MFTKCLRRLLFVTLQYRNLIKSSKLGATAAASIAFILPSLQRSTKYPIYSAYPVRFSELIGNIREFIIPKKTPKNINGKVPYRFVTTL
ncbi:hypothetical protein TNCV_556801 [Trichonephila clavipes]|uniref:Uncharacterized protein n=1 Tax=Trichonephila clavipes TaxID=2585209 RepID=A0A8X6RMH9_TRICX|nr:hypothetical protein TNCV_556801 [Trichonephila clavipes]